MLKQVLVGARILCLLLFQRQLRIQEERQGGRFLQQLWRFHQWRLALADLGDDQATAKCKEDSKAIWLDMSQKCETRAEVERSIQMQKIWPDLECIGASLYRRYP